MNEPMTFLDFFSGVGGFRKDFELCGMVCKGHCEIDKFADRSYRAIHDVKEDEWYGEDITKTEPADLPRVNLWAGGFPCQDISVSGRQRGLAGERSSLFFEIVRLLKGTPAEDRPERRIRPAGRRSRSRRHRRKMRKRHCLHHRGQLRRRLPPEPISRGVL